MRAAILLLLAAGAHAVGFRAIMSPMMKQADAKKSCVAQGGSLAKLATLEDLGLLQELTCRADGHPSQVWVGAEYSVTEGEWAWLDGSGLSVTDEIWGDRQPGSDVRADEGIEDCALAGTDGDYYMNGWKLYNVSCDGRSGTFPFVCQIDSLETNEVATVTNAAATTASVMPDCDYMKYRAVHTPMTHADAKASCRAQEGDLASLPTCVQASIIGSQLKCASSYWIGATDQATAGTWLQPDGSTLPTDKSFDFWAPGQPFEDNSEFSGLGIHDTSGEGEHCAILGAASRVCPCLEVLAVLGTPTNADTGRGSAGWPDALSARHTRLSLLSHRTYE